MHAGKVLEQHVERPQVPEDFDGKGTHLHAPTHGSMRVQLADLKPSLTVSPDEAEDMLARLTRAQTAFLNCTQADVDRITHAVARVADLKRVEFARLAVEETGIGLLEDKVIKNHFSAEYVWSKHATTKTVGILDEDMSRGLTTVAKPVGPIASLVPCTNPTSTIVFHVLSCMKTRNTIVFLPHPRAQRVSQHVTEVLLEAAIEAGAPPDCIACVSPSLDLSKYIMQNDSIKFVLATGGEAMVRAAYASGKPTIAVGAGNCAAIIDETADLDAAVGLVVLGKTFDNGVVCATEQAIVVLDEVYDKVMDKLEERGVYFVRDSEDRKLLADTFRPECKLNANVVGKSALTIADMAGIQKPPAGTLVLGVEASAIGTDEPFSFEKLCPILAMYRATDFDHAIDLASKLALNHGVGHTSSLHTNAEIHRDRIRKFEEMMPTCHNLINMPSSLGAIGGPYNMHLEPSLTLGVGTMGGSSESRNLGPQALLNLQTTAERVDHIEWFKAPHSVYFNRNSIRDALFDLALDDPRGSSLSPSGNVAERTRVMVITDACMVRLGLLATTIETIEDMGMTVSVFDGVEPDPSMSLVRRGVAAMQAFEPHVLVAVGGGSAIDGAKVMRLVYEHPDMSLEDMALRFIEIRRRIVRFPQLGSKIKKLVCIPTTSGTGAEVTPFAVITGDDKMKYPITSYALVPEVAIVDVDLAMSQPTKLATYTGLDALAHALESMVSVYASDFTIPLSTKGKTIAH